MKLFKLGGRGKLVLGVFIGLLVISGVVIYRAFPFLESRYYLGMMQKRGLPYLPGAIPAYSSEGYQEKAREMQALLEEMLAFYEERLGIRADLRLAVLAQSDWKAVIPLVPYGLPMVRGNPSVAAMPATSGGAIHDSALSLRDGLSQTVVEQIEAEGLSYEEAVDVFVDLIGLHELGHHLAGKYGIAAPARWLDEMVATYFAYAFLAEKRPRLQRIWDLVATQAYLDAASPAHRTLEDFEKLYIRVGVHNYCWYQAMFNRRVSEIRAQRGLDFFSDLQREFPAGDSGAGAALKRQARLTPVTLIERLELLAPGFSQWAESF